MAPNGFGGGIATIFMVLPFLFILVGAVYITLAVSGRHKRRQASSVRVLPVGAEHPLSHLRSKMKPVPVKPQPEQKAAGKQRPRRPEPPWLTRV